MSADYTYLFLSNDIYLDNYSLKQLDIFFLINQIRKVT